LTVRGGPAVAACAVLVVTWAVSAWFLWPTTVPSSLALAHVDSAPLFSPSVLRRADRYDHVAALLVVAGLIVKVAVFAFYARSGPGFVRESAAGPVGTGMLLGMLGFGLLWLAQVPVAVISLWWDRRYHVGHGSYWHAVLGGWLQLGFSFVLLCVALGIVMGAARVVGDWWWLLASPAFVGLVTLFAFVTPYLLTTHRVDGYDPALQRSVTRLEQREGIGHVPVRVQNVSSETSAPNAFAAGIGPSRRVVIWNTLLDGRFSSGEVNVVLAHEFGHLKRNHVLQSVAWYALFTVTLAFVISRVTRRRGGMAEPAAIPLALLTLVVLQLVALPIENEISRRHEAEADWIALQTTHDPRSAERLFAAFVPTTLSDPNPPTWEYLLNADHPTIDQRIAMARAWRRDYAASASASAAQLP
jgi:STE24 endopeptidase